MKIYNEHIKQGDKIIYLGEEYVVIGYTVTSKNDNPQTTIIKQGERTPLVVESWKVEKITGK